MSSLITSFLSYAKCDVWFVLFFGGKSVYERAKVRSALAGMHIERDFMRATLHCDSGVVWDGSLIVC